jgi:hypothetical protein
LDVRVEFDLKDVSKDLAPILDLGNDRRELIALHETGRLQKKEPLKALQRVRVPAMLDKNSACTRV